jgi:hypothetical protein
VRPYQYRKLDSKPINNRYRTKPVQDWLADERHSQQESNGNGFQGAEPLDILEHMLQEVKTLHAERYGSLFEENSLSKLQEELTGLLRAEAWKVLQSRDYRRERYVIDAWLL